MVLFFTLLCLTGFAAAQTARIAVMAHRGEQIRNPENSLSGIRAAIDLGADFVELDVRASLDGRQVLMHDATVDRTTDGRGAIAQWTFGRIRALKLGNEGVPGFEEALDTAHEKIEVYVDAKDLTPAALNMRLKCTTCGGT